MCFLAILIIELDGVHLPFLRQQKGDAASEARRRGFTMRKFLKPPSLLNIQAEGIRVRVSDVLQQFDRRDYQRTSRDYRR